MIAFLISIALLLPAPAWAHAVADGTAGHWNADPLVLVPMVTVAGLYAIGTASLWRRAGVGRGVPVWRAHLFALGIVALIVALVSPLDPSADVSFALHMVQHMLLVVVAAPLIALGQGGVALLRAIGAPMRRPVASMRHLRRMVATVPVATVLHGATIWIWHAPGPYQAAIADDLIHYLEHLSMFATGVLFWWSAFNAGRQAPLGYGAGVAAMFVTMIHTGMLGILITLAPAPLYATYAAAEPLLGLSALEDQQLAGIIMLLPGGIAYLAGGLALLAAWLAAAEHRRPDRVQGPVT